MTSSNPPNFSRRILLLAAGIFLLVAPQSALAKHRHHSDGNKDEYAEKDMISEKHKGKHKHDDESAEKTKDTEQDKTANGGTSTAVTPPSPAPLPHPGTVTGTNAPSNGGVIGGAFGTIAGAFKPGTAGPNTSTSTQQSGSGVFGASTSAIVDALKPKTAGPNTSTQH
jgi:hypothetical protein